MYSMCSWHQAASEHCLLTPESLFKSYVSGGAARETYTYAFPSVADLRASNLVLSYALTSSILISTFSAMAFSWNFANVILNGCRDDHPSQLLTSSCLLARYVSHFVSPLGKLFDDAFVGVRQRHVFAEEISEVLWYLLFSCTIAWNPRSFLLKFIHLWLAFWAGLSSDAQSALVSSCNACDRLKYLHISKWFWFSIRFNFCLNQYWSRR